MHLPAGPDCPLVDTAGPAQADQGREEARPHWASTPCPAPPPALDTGGWDACPYWLHGAAGDDHGPAFLQQLGEVCSWIQEQELEAALTEVA